METYQNNADLICIDYTHPSAVNSNAEFYIKHKIPFIMGTTGGDRDKLMEDVMNSNTYSVIAPNMGKQVVAFQAMMQYMSNNFDGIFDGYSMKMVESH